jgi:hypothetical protein
MNLTPFMIRLTKARSDRLRATIFVAPGRAQELVGRLRDRDVGCWAHSDSTIRVEDALSLVELYERTGICIGLNSMLRDYTELRSFLRPGQKRAPDVVNRLEELIKRILEVQGD